MRLSYGRLRASIPYKLGSMFPGRFRLALCLCVIAIGSSRLAAQSSPRFTNPPALSTPKGYSHIVQVPAGQSLVFLAGQVPLDSAGNLVGDGDFRTQAHQVFENLRIALAAAGATLRDVIKLNYYIVDVAQLPVLREVRDQYVNTASPPVSTLAEVKGLYRPGVFLEVEAVAVVRAH